MRRTEAIGMCQRTAWLLERGFREASCLPVAMGLAAQLHGTVPRRVSLKAIREGMHLEPVQVYEGLTALVHLGLLHTGHHGGHVVYWWDATMGQEEGETP